MRKYIHTALIIFALALPCFGQFTEIWTNGNLFAVDQMASQCYSASVERCQAVGVTPHSPSWFDYLLGKNYAKLSSVKANISAVRPYFVKPSLDVLAELSARDSAVWTNDAHFLNDCGLPTSTIAETPYFKSQYASTTGGWVHCWRMLTNQVVSENAGEYFALTTNTLRSDWWVGSSSGSDTTWDDAKASQAANWSYIDILPFTPARYYFGNQFIGYGTTNYSAEANNMANLLGYSAYSGFSRSATVYHKAGALTEETVGYSITNSVFDSQGTSASNGWWYVGAIAETNAETATGLLVGIDGSEFNDPGIPSPPDEPFDTYPVFAVSVKGWYTYGQRVILNWTTSTNGFKYK